jgi:hypothetical protein
MGAGAVEGGEGLIEHRNDPLLLLQRWEGDRDLTEILPANPAARRTGAACINSAEIIGRLRVIDEKLGVDCCRNV